MYTTTTINPNPIVQNSILGSKYLDPNNLFNHLVAILGLIFNAKVLEFFYGMLSFFAIVFVAIIVYSTIRIFEIRKKEHAYLHHEIEEYKHHQALHEEERSEVHFKNPKWKKVLNYLFSDNENDWKLAIIESDSMLFELLSELGFAGDTLGDKLKNADRDAFPGLNDAWEVHNIRNKIAHEGSAFELSLHEAKRVIDIYEKIFQQFGFI